MEIMREMHFSAMRTDTFINKSNKSVYFFLGQIHQSTKFQSTVKPDETGILSIPI
jgi:hypothetical protein